MLNDPAGFYPEEPAARRAYGRLLRHRADAAERARRHDDEHDTRTPSLTQNSTHPTDAADDEPTFVPGRTVGETAAAAARTRAAKATVAETAAFVRAAGGTAGVGGVATECGDECDVYDVNRRDLSHLRGTLRRRGDVWVTFTKIKEQVEAVLADPASVRCPHVVGTDRDAWRRSPHVAVSERVAPNTRLEMSGRSSGSSSVIARGGSVARKVYCAECWEKMEVKRLASVVRCADCGDRFPLSKTAPFPVRRTLGELHGSSASGEDIVDVCFLCAPGWEPRRAEEAARRGLANDPARWNAEDAAADAAAAELRAMPREDRVRLLHATLGERTTRTRAKKKNKKNDAGEDDADDDDEDGNEEDEEEGAGVALDRRLRDGPDLYPWQVGHPAQAKMRENRSSDPDGIRTLDAPPATIGAAAVEDVARAQDDSWAVAGTDVVARGAPGARTRMLPIDRFDAMAVAERCSTSPPPDVADFAERAMRRAIALDAEAEADPAEVELETKARETFVRSLMERRDLGRLDADGARRCLESVEDAAASCARAAMGDLLVNAVNGPVSEEEILANALRRFDDDAEAAAAEAARIAGERTAAEFNARARVDAAEEEERALALDRQRLEDILGRDGGLRRYLAEEARSRGDPDDAYGGELDGDGDGGDGGNVREEGRGDDDNFWAGVDIEDEDADRLLTAEERAEREREDRERKRREAREAARAAARAKLEKWASKGMDFGEYGDDDDDDDARDVARKETGEAGTVATPPADAPSPTRKSSPMRPRRTVTTVTTVTPIRAESPPPAADDAEPLSPSYN